MRRLYSLSVVLALALPGCGALGTVPPPPSGMSVAEFDARVDEIKAAATAAATSAVSANIVGAAANAAEGAADLVALKRDSGYTWAEFWRALFIFLGTSTSAVIATRLLRGPSTNSVVKDAIAEKVVASVPAANLAAKL